MAFGGSFYKTKSPVSSGTNVLSKAFQGVYIQDNKSTLCDVALDLECRHEMLSPSIQSSTAEVRTFSVKQAEAFSHGYKTEGLSIESSKENAGISDNGMPAGLQPKRTGFYHYSVHTTLPTFRCSLQRENLKLSKPLLDELKELQDTISNCPDKKHIQSCVKDIFKRYGSHVYVGDIHFGGIFSWEASYQGIEKDAELVCQNVESALNEGREEKTNSHDTSIDVSFSTSKKGGPRYASSFKPWRIGLEADRNLGTVIDRGRNAVGIWEILLNHLEICDVSHLRQTLFDTWEQAHYAVEETFESEPALQTQVRYNAVCTSFKDQTMDDGYSSMNSPVSATAPDWTSGQGVKQPPLRRDTEITCNLQVYGEYNDDGHLQPIPETKTHSYESTAKLPILESDVTEIVDDAPKTIDVLKYLELESYYPEKISLQDIMEIGDIQLKTKTPMGKVPWNILRNLLMLNKTAVTSEVQNCQTGRQPRSDKGFSWDAGFTNTEDLSESDSQLHPSDVFMAIFACWDLNLRERLVNKMLQCRLAVPLLFPDITSKQLTYSLWPLRTSTLSWSNPSGDAEEALAVSYPVKVVSCVRLGRPQSSKSKFLNNIISDQIQETFLNEDSVNGNKRRQFTDGLVEASIFLPSGKKNEGLKDPTIFLNLRGDGTKFDKQVDILGQLSNAVIASIDVSELNKNEVVAKMKLVHRGCKKVVMMLSNKQQFPAEKFKKCLQEYSKTIGPALLKNVQTLTTFTQGREKNVAQITSEARELLKGTLKHEKGKPLESAFDLMISHHVTIDEMSKHCQEGRKLADKVMSQKTKGASKEKLLPLQGNHWKEWCKLLKSKKRSKQTSEGRSSIQEVGREEQQMKAHRHQQNRLCDQISPFVQNFIDGLLLVVNTPVVDFYMQWLKIYLDDISRQNLPELQKLYHGKVDFWNSLRKSQVKNREALEQQISKMEQDIDDVSLGLEHLMREMGQIYEAATESNCKTHQNQFKELPCLAANLLLRGHSLEIMDGDAAGVPLTWLSAVFTELEKKLKNEKLFTLSVLGIQSSGKSTLLNTMFGLQFPVSAGRCTRGVYMQLVKVKPSANLPFSYVAVLDSEGLRAQELGDLKYDHDNELATFIIGLGNVTLINVKGENVSEIKDILQIVSHAFLRMKMVNEHIQKERACVFVHQNVPAVDAKAKMQSGTQKFQKALDKMTVQAAKLENIADIDSFNDVIQFDSRKHVWYFPDLWHGDPPMASVNIGYHEKVKDLKSGLLKDLAKNSKCLFTCSQMKEFIRDMWLGVLADDFVFSFRNGLVTKAYKDLDHKFAELRWQLELALKEWIDKIQWYKESTQQGLQKQCEDLKRQVADVIGSKQDEVIKELINFINTNPQSQFMDPWRKDKEYALKHIAELMIYRARIDIEQLADKEVVNILRNSEQDSHRKDIMQKARQLAEKLKDQSIQDDQLNSEFDKMWCYWINQIHHNEKEKNRIPIWDELLSLLYDEFPHDNTLLNSELRAAEINKRLYRSTLAESCSYADMKAVHPKMKKQSWFALKKTDPKEVALKKIQSIFRDVDSHLRKLSEGVEGFQRHEAKAIFMHVRSELNRLNTDSSECFTIPKNFEIKLLIDVARFSLPKFQKMQEYYESKHSLTAQLNDYKLTTSNMFMNVVRQVGDELILVDLICDELDELMGKITQKHLELEIVKEIVPHFTSKAMLIKAMLRDLAEREEFEGYRQYVYNSKDFSRSWLSNYIGKYIFADRSGSSWYSEQAKIYIDNVIDKVHRSIGKTSEKRHRSTHDWIGAFSNEVYSFIPFKGTTAASFKGTSQSVDFANLEDRFVKRLQKVQTDTIRHFGAHQMDNIWWITTPPHQQVLDAIWGCEAVCSFCSEPCNKSDPNHASPTDCHECIQHRPSGVAFWSFKVSNKICVENCSYEVQSSARFQCYGTDHKCDGTGNTEQIHHPFKEYKTYVPNWNILPSPDMDSSHYWMWYMNKFQVQIAESIKKELPDIPPSWKDITKGSAIDSLSLYD